MVGYIALNICHIFIYQRRCRCETLILFLQFHWLLGFPSDALLCRRSCLCSWSVDHLGKYAFLWVPPSNRKWHVFVVIVVADLDLLNWCFWNTSGTFMFFSKKFCRLLEFQPRKSIERHIRLKALPIHFKRSSPMLHTCQAEEGSQWLCSISACQSSDDMVPPSKWDLGWINNWSYSIFHDLELRV